MAELTKRPEIQLHNISSYFSILLRLAPVLAFVYIVHSSCTRHNGDVQSPEQSLIDKCYEFYYAAKYDTTIYILRGALKDSISLSPNNETRYNLLLSKCYLYNNQGDKALKHANSALRIYEYAKLNEPKDYLDILVTLSSIHYLRREPVQSHDYLSQIFKYQGSGHFVPDSVFLSAYQLLGNNFFLTNNLDSTIHYYSKAIELIESGKVKKKTSLPSLYLSLGLTQRKIGYLLNSQKSYLSALNFLTEYSSSDSTLKSEIFMSYANLLTELGLYNKAICYYDSITYIFEKDNSRFRKFKILAFTNKGNLLIRLGDYYKASSCFLEADQLFLPIERNTTLDHSNVLYLLGLCEHNLEHYQNAVNYYARSKIIKEKSNSSSTFDIIYNLILCYEELKIEDSVEYYLNQGLSFMKPTVNAKPDMVAEYYLDIGILFGKANNNKKCLNNLLLAYQQFTAIYGSVNPQVTRCLTHLGDYYLKQKQNSLSLYYYDKALKSISNHQTIGNRSRESFIKYTSLDNKISYFNISIKRAEAYDMLARGKSPQRIQYLKNALRSYQDAISLISSLIVSFSGQNTKIFHSDTHWHVFESALKCSIKLFDNTGDCYFLDEAYRISQGYKYSLLQSNIASDNAFNNTKISNELLLKYESLSQDVFLLNQEIENELARPKVNPSKLSKLRTELFLENENLSALISQIQVKYPAFLILKHSMPIFSLSDVQNRLKVGDCLIDYFDSDSLLYVFVIDKKCHRLLKIIKDSESKESLRKYISSVNNYRPGVEGVKNYFEFTSCAYLVYRNYIKPVLGERRYKQLYIVPDGDLVFVPFESLLTSPVKSALPYNQLPYLIKNQPLVNLFGVIQLFGHGSQGSGASSLIAFAPYSENFKSSDAASGKQAFSSNLPSSADEIKSITHDFGGRFLLGEKASLENFILYSKEYDVIHLATHASFDAIDPFRSKLMFYPQKNGRASSLTLNEISLMQFNASLVVLSACNSGNGQYLRGNGALSLAYAFACAGCQNVIMSLWDMSDQGSLNLLRPFYLSLKEGNSVASSLRQAKLKYLDVVDSQHAHPHYWAGLILTGANQNASTGLQYSSLLLRLYFVFSICLILIFPIKFLFKSFLNIFTK